MCVCKKIRGFQFISVFSLSLDTNRLFDWGRNMKGTEMKQERGTESVKLCCPTGTFIRDTMKTAKDTER